MKLDGRDKRTYGRSGSSSSGGRAAEGAPLLGRSGGGVDVEAQTRRTFAAATAKPRVPKWVWVIAALVFGVLALYLLGALPYAGSAQSWIRSRPAARHNPAAQLPETAQLPQADLNAHTAHPDDSSKPLPLPDAAAGSSDSGAKSSAADSDGGSSKDGSASGGSDSKDSTASGGSSSSGKDENPKAPLAAADAPSPEPAADAAAGGSSKQAAVDAEGDADADASDSQASQPAKDTSSKGADADADSADEADTEPSGSGGKDGSAAGKGKDKVAAGGGSHDAPAATEGVTDAADNEEAAGNSAADEAAPAKGKAASNDAEEAAPAKGTASGSKGGSGSSKQPNASGELDADVAEPDATADEEGRTGGKTAKLKAKAGGKSGSKKPGNTAMGDAASDEVDADFAALDAAAAEDSEAPATPAKRGSSKKSGKAGAAAAGDELDADFAELEATGDEDGEGSSEAAASGKGGTGTGSKSGSGTKPGKAAGDGDDFDADAADAESASGTADGSKAGSASGNKAAAKPAADEKVGKAGGSGSSKSSGGSMSSSSRKGSKAADAADDLEAAGADGKASAGKAGDSGHPGKPVEEFDDAAADAEAEADAQTSSGKAGTASDGEAGGSKKSSKAVDAGDGFDAAEDEEAAESAGGKGGSASSKSTDSAKAGEAAEAGQDLDAHAADSDSVAAAGASKGSAASSKTGKAAAKPATDAGDDLDAGADAADADAAAESAGGKPAAGKAATASSSKSGGSGEAADDADPDGDAAGSDDAKVAGSSKGGVAAGKIGSSDKSSKAAASGDELDAENEADAAEAAGGSKGSATAGSKGGATAGSKGTKAASKPMADQEVGDEAAEEEQQRGTPNKKRTALATEAAEAGTAQEDCQEFSPAGCFLVPGQVEPRHYPKCDDPPGHATKGGHECSFDEAAEMRACPLPSSGLYFSKPAGPGGCGAAPPFWREDGAEPVACSAGACCSGDNVVGAWKPSSEPDQAMEFKEHKDMGCRFHRYTRLQVLSCLAETNVVFFGDSMVRQLFNRLPDLFRGQRRTWESNRWRAERYDVCEAADLRSLAPSLDYLSPKDYHYLLWGLAEITDNGAPLLAFDQGPEANLTDLLDPDARAKIFPRETCGATPPVSFQFVPTTGFEPAYRFMTPYMNHHKDLSRAVFLTHVGFWDLKTEEPPEKYLNTLQRALDQGLKQLVVLLVPTSMVGIDERDPRRPLLRRRNALMRDWAARDESGRAAVLDFDSLALAPDAPGGLIGNWTDWHYSCKFSWDEPERNATVAELAPETSRWLDAGGWPIGSLQPNDRLDCVDDMNRVVLQVLFNMMCNRRN